MVNPLRVMAIACSSLGLLLIILASTLPVPKKARGISKTTATEIAADLEREARAERARRDAQERQDELRELTYSTQPGPKTSRVVLQMSSDLTARQFAHLSFRISGNSKVRYELNLNAPLSLGGLPKGLVQIIVVRARYLQNTLYRLRRHQDLAPFPEHEVVIDITDMPYTFEIGMVADTYYAIVFNQADYGISTDLKVHEFFQGR